MQQQFELKLFNKILGETSDAKLECLTNPDFNTKLTWNGKIYSYSGIDLYECLQWYRSQLENEDIFILCNGSKIDTYPSGQLRDMSNGIHTYLLEMNKAPSIILNLLGFSDHNIGTIQEQNDYYKKWKDGLRMLSKND